MLNNSPIVIICLASALITLGLVYLYIKLSQKLKPIYDQQANQTRQIDQLLGLLNERTRHQEELQQTIMRLLKEQQQEQHQQRTRFDEHQINSLRLLQDSLAKGMAEIRHQVTNTLTHNTELLTQQVSKLTESTDQRLKDISKQVDQRLSDGFDKTNATFMNVLERLQMIDEAQKKITELSSNVISLQEVLSDKRSRGAFGEVQLSALVRNVLPESNISFQHTLSNNKRVDCMLFLPEPTGKIAIDAKFPLENYRKLTDIHLPETERIKAEQLFRQDIQKHIQDIAQKYIITGETSDGAMMFIPAEAVFAEIHAHYPELVEIAQKAKVWMVSPTTMMAILTTARAVIKDAATRQQVHIIQDHLIALSKDFGRFQERMDNLKRHISQAHSDVDEVYISSKKITSRFNKIEGVELTDETMLLLDEKNN